MATMVTRYMAEDGTLHESREDADRHEATGQILRLIEATAHWGNLMPEVAGWIAAHLPELEKISRWPSLAKETVDEYLAQDGEAK